jgi:hypothetical protein
VVVEAAGVEEVEIVEVGVGAGAGAGIGAGAVLVVVAGVLRSGFLTVTGAVFEVTGRVVTIGVVGLVVTLERGVTGGLDCNPA